MGTNLHGKDAALAISSDGVTYVDVGGVMDITVNVSNELAEVTDKDSNGHKEYISGLDDATVDLSIRWEEDDAGQADLLAAFFAKTIRYYRVRPETTATATEYLCQGFVSEHSTEMPTDDAISVSATIQVSGGLTATPQA